METTGLIEYIYINILLYIIICTYIFQSQDNYIDDANVDDDMHEENYRRAKIVMSRFKGKTVFIRNYTTLAALSIPDNSIDFIYIDARHDYCGCYEDIVTWWPKLKIGGLMSGT